MALEMADCCPLPADAAAPLIPLRLKLSLGGRRTKRSSNTRPNNANWNSRMIDQNASLSFDSPLSPPRQIRQKVCRRRILLFSLSLSIPGDRPQTRAAGAARGTDRLHQAAVASAADAAAAPSLGRRRGRSWFSRDRHRPRRVLVVVEGVAQTGGKGIREHLKRISAIKLTRKTNSSRALPLQQV